MRPFALVVLLCFGCRDVVTGEFERAKTLALARSGPAPEGWRPDVTVRIATGEIERIARAEIDAALRGWGGEVPVPLPFGLNAAARPELVVSSIEVEPDPSCDACFRVALGFEGRLVAKSVLWLAIPVQGGAAGIVEVRSDARIMRLTLRSLGQPHFAVAGVDSSTVVSSERLTAWVEAALPSSLLDVPLVRLDDPALPLRDLRVRADGDGVVVEALSDVASPGALPPTLPHGVGVSVAVAPDTLLAVARRHSFNAPLQDGSTVIEPISLQVSGARFTVGIRLWHPNGWRGWWREYDLSGAISVRDGRVTVASDALVDGARSGCARAVDPVAALAEGYLADVLVAGATRTWDAMFPVGPRGHAVTLRSVAGVEGAVVLDGDFSAW